MSNLNGDYIPTETWAQSSPQAKPPMPPNQGGNRPMQVKREMCALSVLIVIVGIISVIAGFIIGANTDESAYMVGGVLSGVLYFALAVIVDACDKYRKS